MKKYTDQEFLYRQTPVNYDGIAKFTSIKGNTLGWNQLVQNGNFASASGWSSNVGGNTLSASSNELTITINTLGAIVGIYGSRLYNRVSNHKYLFKLDVYVPHATTVRFGNDGEFQRNINTGWNTVSGIAQSTSTSKVCTCYISATASQGFSTGESFKIRNYQCFDLTQMDLDITSVDEFTSLFPLPYYDYNQGTLIPFSGNGIKTVGFNQWDEEWENGTFNTTTGENLAVVSQIRSKNFIDVLPNTTYFVNANPRIWCLFFDGNKQPIHPNAQGYNIVGNSVQLGFDIQPFTTPANARYMRFYCQASYGNSYKNDICINISDTSKNGTYEPYTETSTDLPISTYFPTGMKRAGNVYDELTENKAITRVGAVDLGTLTWIYDASTPRFYTQNISSIIKKPLSNDNIANITSVYEAFSLNGLYNQSIDKCIAVSTGGVVSVKDTSYSDVTTFQTAMNAVYLYYELATETETDIDTEIFYPFYGGGTEQILPVNGSTPTTAPIVADIVYYTKIDTNTPYRKFWLVNGNGDRWNLTEKELKSFLDSPQGLGFQKSIDVTRYGERAYKNTETYNFPQVSGDIFFYDTVNATRYEKYNEFVRFLMVQPLTLYYQIPVSIYSGIADIYTLDCEVINLTKTESKTNRVLTSNIQINGLGFYQGDTVEINGTSATVTINNDGDFPVGFEIEISGDLKNPYFTLEQDGELYGEAKFNDDSSNFSSVYVDSKDGEQNVVLKQNDSILPNPLAYQDLSISNGSVYVTFVKLEKGVSTLTIGDDNDSVSGYTIRFTPMYRSV